MIDWQAQYAVHEPALADFWQRRRNQPAATRTWTVFGHPLRLDSNDPMALTAVDEASPLYSLAPAMEPPLGRIQLVVQPAPQPPGPAPDDLMQHILYSGDDAWLMLHLGRWGHAFVDLEAARAVAVLTPELAARPDLVSQCLLHTVVLNFLIAHGYGLLHASWLVAGDQALLLLAPHNTGKSTTALRLALAGWPLLTDSMVFVSQSGALLGFPVGKIKLRADVLPHFPELAAHTRAEVVREETKYSLDLRTVDRGLVVATAVSPARVRLCLLARGDGPETQLLPATADEVAAAVLANSLYVDRPAVWRKNLERLSGLVRRAAGYHLRLGSDGPGIVTAVQHLRRSGER